MSGTVASIKAKNGFDDSVTVYPSVSLDEIDSRLTTKSRRMSPAIENDNGFVRARILSYPPKVNVPRVAFPGAA